MVLARKTISFLDILRLVNTMATSNTKHLNACRLVCAAASHDPIELPHLQPVTIGRSRATRIADKKVSREHLELTADHMRKIVTVKQLGSKSGQVGDSVLAQGTSAVLTEGTTLYVLAANYPHTVQFESRRHKDPNKPQESKGTVADFFKPRHKDNGKRTAENDDKVAKKPKRIKVDDAVTMDDEDAEDADHLMEVQQKLNLMKEVFGETSSGTTGTTEARDVVPTSEAKWEEHNSLVVYTSLGVRASQKIAAFDIDGCIITTKSGKVFPQNTMDWKIQYSEIRSKLKKLIADSYKVVFFTNQMGIRRGKVKLPDFKEKVESIITALGIPVQVFVASGPGPFRKPGLGMWKYLLEQKNDGIELDTGLSFYVGDAAGRPEKWAPGRKKDFAISDRLFALNAGLDFYTPEEYFLAYKKAAFKMPEFDPRELKSDGPLLSPPSATTTLGMQEIIVNVGLPGSGKSHFTRQHLVKKGYIHVNRDTLGSWQKCVEATKRAVKDGRSVVVDNTNPDPESRKRYLDIAVSTGIPCRCFWFDVSIQQCRHNERFREMTDKSHQAINEMIFNQQKSRFKPPQKEEGFTEIVKVNFITKFKDREEETLYRQFL